MIVGTSRCGSVYPQTEVHLIELNGYENVERKNIDGKNVAIETSNNRCRKKTNNKFRSNFRRKKHIECPKYRNTLGARTLRCQISILILH